jgi:hypothetical protein
VRCADFVELGLAEASSRLASVLGTRAGRSGEEGLAEGLQMLAGSTRLIVVVDGADAADSATMSLLRRVASRLTDCDVLFLFTARGPLSGWTLGNPRRIELPRVPTPAGEAAGLRRDRAHHVRPARIVQQRTAG